MFLIYPESKADITTASVIDCMLRFKESSNRRISNLASVFLQDYCTSDQIQNTRILSSTYSTLPRINIDDIYSISDIYQSSKFL
ncbi:unnamed protein product [Larinioides sclopetarius]